MRKIIIAGSATFYKEALELKQELENKNYYVIDYLSPVSTTSYYLSMSL